MSDSDDIDAQIMKLKQEIKDMEEPEKTSSKYKSEDDEEVIKIVEKPKKIDGRKKPRTEAQKANLAKMREAKLLKAAEKKRAAELKALKDKELAEEIERKKMKAEYKKRYKKKYVSSSSSSSSEIIVKKKKKEKKEKEKKKKKKYVSSSSSGSMSPIFKIESDKTEKVEKISTKTPEPFKIPDWAM